MKLITSIRPARLPKSHPPQVHARLNALQNKADMTCLMLGAMGLSTAAIARNTGLTEGQVLYRLAYYKISRKAYRNGDSAGAQWIIGKVERDLQRRIEGEIRQNGHLITMGGG